MPPRPTQRCQWAFDKSPLYTEYHDKEWGVPVYDDKKIFEFLVLESAQAGLSWSTVLNKRENYRKAFARFDVEKIARFTAKDVERLLGNPGIIRNRAKIEAAINNARRFLEVKKEFGTFAKYIWSFVGGKPVKNCFKHVSELPAVTEESQRLSKDLKKRGFKFLGPTVIYAHMQATGMVNDHIVTCFRYKQSHQNLSQLKSSKDTTQTKREEKMRERTTVQIMLAVSFILLTSLNAGAYDTKDVPTDAKATVDTTQMKDDHMELMMKYGSPGENHKVLEPLIGKWDHTVRWWMSPEAPAQESQGRNENTWIMGGRFLQQTATGTAMDQPFEGMGLTGYDNVREEYISIWIDNMGTGMMSATGQYDPVSKTITEAGTLACPMTGEKNKSLRSEWKIIDQDNYTYLMYSNAPDGKEFKTMEVVYTRVKE